MIKNIYTIALCLSIAEFTHASYNYFYMQSKKQNGATCGYYALANAHAVQQLFNENKEISPDTIGRLTEQTVTNFFAPFFESEFNQLSDKEKKQYGSMLAYAESKADLLDFDHTVSRETAQCNFFTMMNNGRNTLDNAYAIQYVPKEREKNHIFIVGSNNADIYGCALQNINEVDKKIVHFLYNLGSDKSGHWVYIGVIKQPNQNPYILHLNSTNNNSYETSQEFKTIVQQIDNCMEYKQSLMSKNSVRQNSQKDIKEDENAQLAQAMQMSLHDEEIAKKIRQEETDCMYAKQLQEKEDFMYAQRLQKLEETKNKDLAYAKKVQEQQDYDYALALSLSEGYN
ncbi:MAG TPA: hypothetical protein VL201_00465 [Patescibacteria group bacterium]|jgi:hypothetical protein|nr:hypothetical protein [Patescibacteria group bacterium]